MTIRQSYDQWSATYDTQENKTRDLEKLACRQVLAPLKPEAVIELGCGTGKNTEWLATIASHITAVDFSEEMMAVAKLKVTANNVVFQLADITKPWTFTDRKADLLTCSLVLEHVHDLNPIFTEAKEHLKENGHFYVCELHPYKQYSGSKAKMDSSGSTIELECFIHHISDYLRAAASHFQLIQLNEWFDTDDGADIPRLVSFLFRRL